MAHLDHHNTTPALVSCLHTQPLTQTLTHDTEDTLPMPMKPQAVAFALCNCI